MQPYVLHADQNTTLQEEHPRTGDIRTMPNKVRIIHKLIGGPSAHISVDISLTIALTLEMTNQDMCSKVCMQ